MRDLFTLPTATGQTCLTLPMHTQLLLSAGGAC